MRYKHTKIMPKYRYVGSGYELASFLGMRLDMSVTEFLENFGLDHRIHCVERRPVLLQAREVYMVVSRSKF